MTISLTWPQFLIELLSVLILFLFLRKMAFPPIVKAMKNRAEHIRNEIDAAEARRREAEELKAGLEQDVKEMKARADQALARALKDAEDQARSVLDEARHEAKRLVNEAELEIRREREAALAQIRAQIADLAITVAERVLEERLDAPGDQKLVHRFVERIGVQQ